MRGWIAIFVLCTLCGCQALHVNDILTEAERQLSDAPDSALVTLQSVKRHALLRPKVRARYGLLYSAALDKNFVDVASDSLIRYSASYYDVHGTAEERMRSYYYLGRTCENAKNYQQALLYYLDAAQYTESVEDNYLKGLLYSNLGEMYQQYYNYEKAYKYAEQSYHFYKEAKLLKHQVYQLYMMGALCNNLNNYDKGITLLNKAIKLANECNYEVISCWSKSMLVIINNKLNNFDENYALLEDCERQYGDNFYNGVNICGAAADVYTRRGCKTKAEKLIDKGWKYAMNSVDSSLMYYHLSKMYLFDNQLVDGYNCYNKTINIQLTVASQNMGGAIASAQSKYFTQKAVAQKNRADRERIVYSAILIIIIIIIVIIAVSIHTKEQREIHKKEGLINQYLDVVKALQIELDDRNSRLRKISDETLRDRCTTINQLCRTYFETTQSKRQQAIIFNEVKNLVTSIGSEAYLTTIENCINQYCDNLLVHLKNDVPKINDKEYQLACYLCIGFSTQVMCLVFECTPEVLYRRIYRLRDKIRHCSSDNKDLFLKYI